MLDGEESQPAVIVRESDAAEAADDMTRCNSGTDSDGALSSSVWMREGELRWPCLPGDSCVFGLFCFRGSDAAGKPERVKRGVADN